MSGGSVKSWSSVMKSVFATASGSASRWSLSKTYSLCSLSPSASMAFLLRLRAEPGLEVRSPGIPETDGDEGEGEDAASIARCGTESSRSCAPSSFITMRHSGGMSSSGESRLCRSWSKLQPHTISLSSQQPWGEGGGGTHVEIATKCWGVSANAAPSDALTTSIVILLGAGRKVYSVRPDTRRKERKWRKNEVNRARLLSFWKLT